MPHPVRNLFGAVCSDDNLRAAWREARRGKRYRRDAAAFALDEERERRALVQALRSGRWRPAGFRVWPIRDPKPRLIAAAPFRDRVVHHALHRVIAPHIERGFRPESYACLARRGAHRAVIAFQAALRRWPVVARLDARRYFLEIRWPIVRSLVARRVADRGVLALVDAVLASGAGVYADPAVLSIVGLRDAYTPEPAKGLPIGALTSQLFANQYLDGLDHFAKRSLRVAAYLRYMDDVVLFGPDRATVAA